MASNPRPAVGDDSGILRRSIVAEPLLEVLLRDVERVRRGVDGNVYGPGYTAQLCELVGLACIFVISKVDM